MGSNMIFLTSTVTPLSIKCSSGADERRKECKCPKAGSQRILSSR